ncbi:MAG TPA: site-specific integrase [Acetobacteraceae bacterium]|nr:site-specific integrase [Acetobacteraceae bacterium]
MGKDIKLPPRQRGRQARVAWPVEAWPEPDRLAWARATAVGDLLDDGGAAADWREATRRSAVGAYGRWLAHLAAEGALDPAVGPAERITPEAIRRYLAVLQPACSSTTVASYIAVLAMMLQALAPEQDWAWLNRVQARLQRRATPSRDKRPRIVPAAELFAFGLDLMAEAEAAPAGGEVEAALAFRDGLIALLATRPLRQRNLLAIEIGRHLLQVGEGWLLTFGGEEMKTHRPLEVTVPRTLHTPLERYLRHWRPLLLAIGRRRHPDGRGRAAGERLWVTIDGTAVSVGAQQKALARRTRARFGQVVNAHLFRDCAATSIAAEDPDHVRMAAQLLGHASLRTTERYYVAANTRSALRRHHDRIREIRLGAGPGLGRAGRA